MSKFLSRSRRPFPALTISAYLGIGLTGALAGYVLASESKLEAAAAEHPVEWDGHRWSEFSSPEKDAFLGGFLAGAAASQAYSLLMPDTVFDPQALGSALSKLRSDGGLSFPYGLNLYHARLHDYYFYIDRRERPIYRAISELNFQLQTKD